MKVALALLVTLVSVNVMEAAEDVIDNPEKCFVDRQFRNLFDRGHNKLRLSKGLPEMVYDCEFEEHAREEEENNGYLDGKGYGKLVFERTYDRSVLRAVERAFNELKSDANAVALIANPEATRFGCWGRLFRVKSTGEKKTRVTCAYDKK
ncbi:SCP-like protein [Ancylostoma caninum]|uniref:SCP-like protein n=1 Tax=Ancylostoma caninum TaxID=29170 RepID=A0A368GXZ7_ANCCA|nr:SCP-like protein [Ancylostoma caninum]